MDRSTSAVAAQAAASSSTDWLLVAAPGIIWGASFLFIAEGLKSVSPNGITFIRIFVGFVTLAFFPAARKPVGRSAWAGIVPLAILWFAFPLSMFPFAEQRVSSALTGMLNAVTPLFAAIVAAIIARKLPSSRIALGVLTGILGSVLIALPSFHEGRSSAVGVVLILLACGSYGIALNLARPLQQKYSALAVTWRGLGIAALATAPLGLPEVAAAHWKAGPLLSLLTLGALGTGIAFVLIGMAATRVGATRAAAAAFLIPPISLLLGVVVRGEHVALLSIIGSVVCVAGAWMIRPQPAKPQSQGRHGRKSMSPELKTFIDSIAGEATKEPQDKAEPADGVLRRVARNAKALLTFIADALEEMGPYTCELRPVRKVKSVIAGCWARRDAIGHHGLA